MMLNVRMSGCQDCWDVPQGFFSGVDPAEDGLKEARGVRSNVEKKLERGVADAGLTVDLRLLFNMCLCT